MRTRIHLLALGCLFDLRHALYLVVKALRIAIWACYTRLVGWELDLQPESVEYGLEQDV